MRNMRTQEEEEVDGVMQDREITGLYKNQLVEERGNLQSILIHPR